MNKRQERLEREAEERRKYAALLAAAKAVMVDLDHYVSTHGPGPDRRRDALRAAVEAAEGRG